MIKKKRVKQKTKSKLKLISLIILLSFVLFYTLESRNITDFLTGKIVMTSEVSKVDADDTAYRYMIIQSIPLIFITGIIALAFFIRHLRNKRDSEIGSNKFYKPKINSGEISSKQI
jgi:hypothetical protein